MIKKLEANLELGTYTGRSLPCGAIIIMLGCISRNEITDLPSVLLVSLIHLDISVCISITYLQYKNRLLLCVPMAQSKLYLSAVLHQKEMMYYIIKMRLFRNGLAIQLSSLAQSCPTLCNPMNGSTPSLPVHHQLPEFTQTHVH